MDCPLMRFFSSHGPCIPPIRNRISSLHPELNKNYKVKKNVLRLYVPVNNQLLMNVVNSFNDLPDDSAHLRLLHSPVLPQHFEQLPSCTILDQQVNILFVLEISIQRRNISVSQIKLNAQLSGNLALIFLVSDLLFLHYLHSTQKSSLFMLDQHHLTELAFSKLFSYNKIVSLEIHRFFNFHFFQCIDYDILFVFLVFGWFLECKVHFCFRRFLLWGCIKFSFYLLYEFFLLKHSSFCGLLGICISKSHGWV